MRIEGTLLTMPRLPFDASHVLLPFAQAFSSEVQLDALLNDVVARIAHALNADRGTLYLVDEARGELVSRAAQLPELNQIRLKLGQGAAGTVAKSGKLLNAPATRDDKRFFSAIDKITGYQTKSILAAPVLASDERVVGVIQVLNRRDGVFGPDDEERLTAIARQLAQALRHTSLWAELERSGHKAPIPLSYCFNHIIGESSAMKALYAKVLKAAPTEATVLIRGESGTGKELFARAVHANSRRKAGPFIKVDCAALPAALIENELFGHEKGAFTGADARHEGKVEVARGGTLFLDELGELPLAVQGKLLRLLQDREFERVGGTQTVKADVRVVAATHRDLGSMVKQGTFRQDLYFRIKVVELGLPTLRERGAVDIERLARHFVAQAADKHHLESAPVLTDAALSRLHMHAWPGNVRELENCLESAAVLCDGEILVDHLPLPQSMTSTTASAPGDILSLAQAEQRHIQTVLEHTGGNRSEAARLLGIGRNTLVRKLR